VACSASYVACRCGTARAAGIWQDWRAVSQTRGVRNEAAAGMEKRLSTLETTSLDLKSQLIAVMSRALSWESACGLSTDWLDGCSSRVQLWGERNSGTNALQYLMQENFGIQEADFFRFGHKHMFMKRIPAGGVVQAAQSFVPAVVMVREPLEWLLAMHRKPHHANNLVNTTLDEFVHAEWNFPRGNGGGDKDEYSRHILELRSVKLNFLWNTLNSHNSTPFLYVRKEDMAEDLGVRVACALARQLRLCPASPFIRPLDRQVRIGLFCRSLFMNIGVFGRKTGLYKRDLYSTKGISRLYADRIVASDLAAA